MWWENFWNVFWMLGWVGFLFWLFTGGIFK